MGIPATCYALCEHYGVQMPWPIYWIIGSSAWLVYLLDHFVDAQTSKLSISRYNFIGQRKTLFYWLVGILVILNIFLVVQFFSWTLFLFGFLIGLMVFVHQRINTYFVRHSKQAIFKELFVSIIVALVFSYPILHNYYEFKGSLSPLFFLLLINMSNVWLFAHMEFEEDQKNGYPSLAVTLGKKRSKQMLGQYNFLILILLATQWNFWSHKYFLVCLVCMLLSLQLFLRYDVFFKKGDRYRFWGDFIYLYPLMAALIQKLSN